MKNINTPKGTRDFGPKVFRQRQYIIDKIKEQFNRFGFDELETPSMEKLETLTGKYGEEGDRLIFKILNSGNFLRKVKQEDWDEKDPKKWIPKVSEKALRYDLTVPFARYVAQNFHELSLPFKRYQVQPVWRADNPQNGRYREFYQCDADVIGTESLWAEVDLILLYDSVFNSLGLKVVIEMNNRKILTGIVEQLGVENQLTEFLIALDKLDKIGQDAVIQELQEKGINHDKVAPIFSALDKDLEGQISFLKDFLKDSEIGLKGLDEFLFIHEQINKTGLQSSELKFNLTLARGLDYYTGSIFEVKVPGIQLGSIGAGGRYDDLTGIFGLKGISGVGISFGLDRIYLALEQMNLLNQAENQNKILFANFGLNESAKSLEIMQLLRVKGESCYLYPDTAKFKKQMQYANKNNYNYVVMVGEKELNNQQLSIKNMQSGEQSTIDWADLSEFKF